MKKKRIESKRKEGFPALVLFLCGFLAGNLIPNLLWKIEWRQKTIASIYLLGTFANRSVPGTEYLKEVLRIRGGYYLLCTICGFSVFGVPLAVVGTLLLGIEIGALFALSVLEFGFSGGAVSFGLLFPQYLIYIPATLILMVWVYELSHEIWKNKGLFPKKTGRYVLRTSLGAVCYIVGIFLECYINPWIVEKVLEFIKFF